MPRLSPTKYIKIHGQLRTLWLTAEDAYALLPAGDQRAIHDFFRPVDDLTDSGLRAHRQAVTDADPSLPHRAGKAVKHFQRVMQGKAPPHRVKSNGLQVSGIVRPDPDYDLLAKAFIRLAEQVLARKQAEREDN